MSECRKMTLRKEECVRVLKEKQGKDVPFYASRFLETGKWASNEGPTPTYHFVSLNFKTIMTLEAHMSVSPHEIIV